MLGSHKIIKGLQKIFNKQLDAMEMVETIYQQKDSEQPVSNRTKRKYNSSADTLYIMHI